MSSRWVASRKATADLVSIRNYTIEQWGPEQARTYLRSIANALDQVVSNPFIRRSVGDELPGYFRLAVGSHVAFYRVLDDDQIRVERILHRRMDFETHL